MIKIKFNNKETFEEVEFSRTEHTVTLKDITEENTSGLCTYRLSGEQLGDFSDFTTIYDKGDDYIVFSNDGSVKPEPQPYEPTDSTEPTEPTWKETIEAQVLYTAIITDTMIGGK